MKRQDLAEQSDIDKLRERSLFHNTLPGNNVPKNITKSNTGLVCLCLFFFLPAFAWGQTQVLEPETLGTAVDPTHDLPASWQAEAWIFDQNGKPVAGASVGIDQSGLPPFFTDSTGRFIVERVQPETIFVIHKENYLSSSYQAADLFWFFSDNGTGQAEMRLPFFNQRFEVGPEGGVIEGELDMHIPRGALDKTVEIKVAVLPPGYMVTSTNSMVPLSYGAVYFEPSGLQFHLPVRVRQSAVDELKGDKPAPTLCEIVEHGRGFALRTMHDANVEVEGMDWYYSLTHFSGYRIIDGNRLVHTEVPPNDPRDINMDGVVNEQDAERILWLEGGTQSYEYELNFKQTQTLTQREATSTKDEHDQTTETEAGASFGGIKLGASSQVSLSKANQLAEQLGYEVQVSRSLSYRLNMEVKEYLDQCKMVFTRWNFLRFREYVKADKLTSSEKQRITSAYEKFLESGQEWVHLREQSGGASVGQGSFLPGQSLAVRRNSDGELEVYAMVDSYVLRTLRGFSEGNCDRFTSPGRHRLRYEDYPIPGGPDGAASYTMEYKGYFPMEPPDNIHNDMECGNEVTIEIKETRSRMGFREITATTETEEGKSSSLSASGSINLPYGVGISGGVSTNTSRTQSATNTNSFGSNESEQDETTLIYRVIDAHEHHLSDHYFYRLFHLYEMRDWYFRWPDEVNISDFVRENMQKNTQVNSRTRGRTRDGGLALLRIIDGKEYWYVAGPPVELIREAGYYLKRIAERPCGEAPMPVVPIPEQPKTPRETAPGQSTTPRETIPGREAQDTDAHGRMGTEQTSVPRGLIGGSVSLPFRPTAIDLGEDRFWENYNQAVFEDPSVLEQLFERFGGEFFPGNLSGQESIGGQLDGSASLMPGLFAGMNLNAKIEIVLGVQLFHNKWEMKFPMIIFPYEGNEQLQDQGVLSASAKGILTQANLRYVFPGKVQPYFMAGIGRTIITDSQSNMVLAGLELPFDISGISSRFSAHLGAGVRVVSGSNIFLQAGASIGHWPGSDFRPGGSVCAGYLFNR